jgi:protein-disulfide isomerase
MRAMLALIAAVALVGAAPPDWRTTVGTGPGGGFTAGNPAAKVKLVEYLSFTCSHCADFAAASKPKLHDTMVRNGSVQTETRAAARDPYDLAAWVIARCGGPRRFAALSRAIFAAQESWMTKGSAYAQANLATLRAMDQRAQLRTIIAQSGLGTIATQQGLPGPALAACLKDDAQITPIIKMTESAFSKIQGTPGFEVNGEIVTGVDWSGLEARLRAAGAQ